MTSIQSCWQSIKRYLQWKLLKDWSHLRRNHVKHHHFVHPWSCEFFFPFEIRTNDQKPDPNFRKQHPSAGSKVYAVMLGETCGKSSCQRHLPGHARASGMPPGVGVVSYEASKRKIHRFLGRGDWMRSTKDEQFLWWVWRHVLALLC